MKIYFIRHFKTKGNTEKRYIGRTDEPLCEEANSGEQKRYPSAEAIVVSPMKRCRQTAERIYPGQEQILCDDLRECDFGLFEGKCYEELKDVVAYQEWLSSRGTRPFPKGEAHEAFKARCVSGFTRILDRLVVSGCGTAAVVVHGGTIMAILEQFDKEGREFYHWQVKNGEGYCASLDESEWEQGKRYLMEIEKL